jgi:hypothetical protein
LTGLPGNDHRDSRLRWAREKIEAWGTLAVHRQAAWLPRCPEIGDRFAERLPTPLEIKTEQRILYRAVARGDTEDQSTA